MSVASLARSALPEGVAADVALVSETNEAA